MADVLSDAEAEDCAREAAATIEGVLGRRCPEMRTAFWTAVDLLYREDVEPGRPPAAAPRPTPDARPPAPPRPGPS